MRRLRIWWYEVRATLREWRYGFRAGLRECWDFVVSPFRAVRSAGTGGLASEVRVGTREFVGMFGDFIASCWRFLWSFVAMVICLPYNLVRLILYGPRKAWILLRTSPPRLVAIVAAVSLTVVGAVGATGGYLWWEHRREFQRGLIHRQIEHYLAASDLESLEAALVRLQALAPDDPTIAGRLDGIRTRSAPLSDPELLRAVMRTHFHKGAYDLAAREAAKLIQTSPLDWEARCMLADEASRRDDRSAVEANLAVLPRAADSADSLNPWVAYYSATLFQRIGDADRLDEMVDYIFLNILPHMRSKEIVLIGHDEKLMLLDCFRLTLSQLDKRTRLAQFWEPAQRVCRSILDSDKAPNVRQLLSLAMAQQMHLEVLKEFHRRRLMTEADRRAFAAEVEDRIRIACERAIALDATATAASIILAEHFFRTGDADRAFATIESALQTCGDREDLVVAKAQILMRTDPQTALTYLDRRGPVSDLNVRMCQTYAQVAYTAGRPDKALVACRRAEKLDPSLLWARRLDAEICLQLGRTTEAAAALQPIKLQLASDPMGCELYVRTMCTGGSYALAEDFLQRIAAENRPVEVLLNAANALLTQQRFDDAVRWAKIVLERDATNAAALLIVGDGLRALAEIDARKWDLEKVRESLRAYRAVQRQRPDHWIVINNIVWLELKALELPQQAYESSEPLRGVQSRTGFPAEIMDTLGEVYVAVGRFDQARQVLEEALRTAGPRASVYTHLALAHFGLNQPELAERYAAKAAEMPNKSPRETAELFDAIRTINQK